MLRSAHLLPRLLSNESPIVLSLQTRSFHHLKTLNTQTFIVLNKRQSKFIKNYYLRWNSTSSSVENHVSHESIGETPINLSADIININNVAPLELSLKTDENSVAPPELSLKTDENSVAPPELSLKTDENSVATPISPQLDVNSSVGSQAPISSGIEVTSSVISDTPIPGKFEFTEFSTLPEEVIKHLGEPSLVSQGLGGWSPSGIAQTFFDSIHCGLDVPWWISIAIGTFLIRLLLLPLVVISQRNAAHFNNYMPQMQMLQHKMSEARKCGNALMAAKYANEMALFMKEKNLNPFKNMLVPLAQAPIFISVFFGLRSMANAPIESMKTGGAFWFTNLTVTDPYYLLPLITTATLLITIELGAEGGIRAQNMKMTRYILRGLPIILFPFIINFPSALLCYWVTSNFISLGQVGLFKVPAVRKFFKIDKLVHHKPEALPMQPKGFVKDFRDTWDNSKIMKKLAEREEFDKLQFRKAGIGPIQKTYPFDPTKQTAKPRDNN